jgi:hypothetical protein
VASATPLFELRNAAATCAAMVFSRALEIAGRQTANLRDCSWRTGLYLTAAIDTFMVRALLRAIRTRDAGAGQRPVTVVGCVTACTVRHARADARIPMHGGCTERVARVGRSASPNDAACRATGSSACLLDALSRTAHGQQRHHQQTPTPIKRAAHRPTLARDFATRQRPSGHISSYVRARSLAFFAPPKAGPRWAGRVTINHGGEIAADGDTTAPRGVEHPDAERRRLRHPREHHAFTDPMPAAQQTPYQISYYDMQSNGQMLDLYFTATPVTPSAGQPVTKWTLSNIDLEYRANSDAAGHRHRRLGGRGARLRLRHGIQKWRM